MAEFARRIYHIKVADATISTCPFGERGEKACPILMLALDDAFEMRYTISILAALFREVL